MFAVIVVVFISLLGVVVGDWWWLRLALVGTAVLVIDGMVSLRALGRAGLTVAVSGPTDAVVGQRSELAVSVQGLSSPALLSLPGPGVWAHVHDGDAGLLSVVHRRRGLFSHLAVLLIHSAPFGLVGASRTLLVELAAPLHVAPQCQPAPGLRLPTTVYGGLDARPRRGSTPELVRGPRQYQPGDPINRVHWPATARAPGTLMVREMESLISRSVVIVADLGPTISSNTFIGVDGLGNFSAYHTAPYAEVVAETAAAWTMWVCGEAWRAGYAVELVTVQDGQTIWAPVQGSLDAGRRLAAATAGRPQLEVFRAHGNLVVAAGSNRAARHGCVWVSAAGLES